MVIFHMTYGAVSCEQRFLFILLEVIHMICVYPF